MLSHVFRNCLRHLHLELTVDLELLDKFERDILLCNLLDVILVDLPFSVDQFLQLVEVLSFVLKGQRHIDSHRTYLLHFLSLFLLLRELGLIENVRNVILDLFQARKCSCAYASTAPASASTHKAIRPTASPKGLATALSASIEAHDSLASDK